MNQCFFLISAQYCYLKNPLNLYCVFQSLGKARTRPQLDPVSNKIVLLYDHGSPCPSNPAANITSKIVFNCKPGPLAVSFKL